MTRDRSAFQAVKRLLLWWSSRELGLLASSFGVLLCLIVAALLCVFFERFSFKEMLPIWFLLIITCIAIRFGFLAGVLGTVLAALIFAEFLFEPLSSIAVQSQAARNNLIWMLLGGVAMSELFGNPPKVGKPRGKR